MIFITSEEELDLSKNGVIYFYAPWMPYHKKMMVMLDKMEEKYNLPFYAIDVSSFKKLCGRFSVDSIPTVVILHNNKTKRINGVVMTSALRSAFADICKIDTI